MIQFPRNRHLFIVFAFLPLLFLFSCRPAPSHNQIKLTDSGHGRANSLLKEINELNGQGRYAAAIQKALYLNKIIEKEVGPSHPKYLKILVLIIMFYLLIIK